MKNPCTDARPYFRFATLVCVLWASTLSLVSAESLDDFKSASEYDDVRVIPFSDLRRDAGAIADDVQRRKEEVQSFSYETFVKEKNNLLKGIKNDKDLIESFKKAIDGYNNENSEIEISPYVTELKDAIEEKNKKIAETINGKLATLNEKLSKAADAFDRLNQARAGLREYFDKALDQLSDAKSNPEKYLGSSPSDDDKSKLQDYISKIEDKIKSQVATHKEQEDGAKNKKEQYLELIKKSEY